MADLILSGSTSGTVTVSAPAISGSSVLTLPVATDTLVGKATTDTLTNKSIAATQLTGTIAAAALPAGSVLQVVNFQTGAVATGTTTIPYDDTIPQITEGTEFMTLAITPKFATSRLLITVTCNIAGAVNQATVTALFQDSTANALAVVYEMNITGGDPVAPTLIFSKIAGTTSSTTFRVRGGGNSAGTMTFNGTVGARVYGGVIASTITIMEIAV